MDIEQVQQNVAPFVTNVYDPYKKCFGTRYQYLSWATLEKSRLLTQFTMFYKIRNNLVNISFPPCVQENPRPTRSNPSKYRHVSRDVLAFSYSFFPRTIKTRNCVPNSVFSAPTIEQSKSASIMRLFLMFVTAVCVLFLITLLIINSIRAPHHLR